MKKALIFLGTVALTTLLLNGAVQAALIIPADISGAGSWNHDKNLIIDGWMPDEGSVYRRPQCVYWLGTNSSFIIDLGKIFMLQDLVLQVDNNDDYRVQYSTDKSSWSLLFNISRNWGEIGWGLDTMSSISGDPQYISGIDFTEVQARYLKFFSTGGDRIYSISELQAYGVVAAPLPGAFWLLGSGILGLIGLRRKL